MKIGITGDTHGNERILRQLLMQAPPVDEWLHTGDYATDANLLRRLSGLPVTAVRGNCDSAPVANSDEILEREGWRIWLTHGHKHMGHTHVEKLSYWAQQLKVNIAIYGHTHRPFCQYYGDILLLNPGSPTLPRGGSKAGFAVLTLISGQKPQTEFIELLSNKQNLF